MIDALRRELGRFQVRSLKGPHPSPCRACPHCLAARTALAPVPLTSHLCPSPAPLTGPLVLTSGPQARVQELEADFQSLSVLSATDVAGHDADLRKAWFTAAAFKKRCGLPWGRASWRAWTGPG
jgi:hypothetical protein